MGKKCLCCGGVFQPKTNNCCDETCIGCHVNLTVNCPNA